MKHKSLVIWLALLASLALAVMFFRTSGEGVTPLMIAAKEGDGISVEQIISEGFNLDQQSAYGWTAVMFASWQGHANIVRLLVDAGANINVKSGPIPAAFSTTSGHPKSDALTEAISNGNFRIAHYLLDHNANISLGALAIAGAHADLNLLEKLAKMSADINGVSDNEFYRTSLSTAARYGKVENMRWLLKQDADPNLSLPHSSNLIEAIRGGQPDAVLVLLEAGAKVNETVGNLNTTALFEAVYGYAQGGEVNKIPIIEILLKNGANPNDRPDESWRSMIEKVERDIVVADGKSRDLELSPAARERYRRSLEPNRIILNLLTSHQN